MTDITEAPLYHSKKTSLAARYQPSLQVKRQIMKRILCASLRESLLSFNLKGDLLFIPLKRTQQMLVATHVKIASLKRFIIKGDILLIVNNEVSELKEVDHLLRLIQPELKGEQWTALVSEIKNSMINATLAARYTANINRKLANEIINSNSPTLYDYIAANYDRKARYVFFEQWATRGHPDHPCHKTKLGFTAKQVLQYSPEFKQLVQLSLAAIAIDCVHIESEQIEFNYQQWFARHFKAQWVTFQLKMQEMGFNAADYIPFFMHPWQRDHQIKKYFSTLLANRQLIIFSGVGISAHPSLSFRTLVPVDALSQPQLKLPVAVQATSAIRTVSAISVHNGPKISRILKSIIAREKCFESSFYIASEVCALHVIGFPADISKNLSMIYRENILENLKETQLPIVAAALFELTPNKRQAFFIEIMHAAVGDALSEAVQYFSVYAGIVINGYLGLFLLYGISLEGHQQNTTMIFENYKPIALCSRDFGGMKVDLATLNSTQYGYEAHPESSTITKEKDEATNTFIHTVMQYHLGELVTLLADHYHVKEAVFWKVVKAQVEACFLRLKDRIDPARYTEEYQRIMHADWRVKGLMRMRLNDATHHNINITVENPLRIG